MNAIEKTVVVFRKFDDEGGDIIVLFPEEKTGIGSVMSYMHIGQHSPASYPLDGTRYASPDEYADLAKELQSIGYDLYII